MQAVVQSHTHLLPLASLPALRPGQQYSYVLSNHCWHTSKHQEWPTQHLKLLLAVVLSNVILPVLMFALMVAQEHVITPAIPPAAGHCMGSRHMEQ